MSENSSDINSKLRIIRETYEEKLPFNRLLGLQVDFLDTNSAGFKFRRKDELVGNYVHGILHGGVISAVLDATDGMTDELFGGSAL
jgi:acyl-coenzyme A thioesterase PaaI-like protein